MREEFCGLLEEAAELQAMALASSTQTQYERHIKWFTEICVAAGCVESIARPPESVVIAYAVYLYRSVKPATVVQYLKGLKDHYRSVGYPEFADPERWPRLQRTLKGMKRAKADTVAMVVHVVKVETAVLEQAVPEVL